eukprot:TRINITY_DN14154_c0_g4_i1.p2 TRINITY_DN14154_c0_g4~~TRINITY_DN14154_c0_g4_i1.p2  ORF type:complete len:238 (-),score=44.51 TRINITY_DN14154_c0_g4_i1:55-768(-)
MENDTDQDEALTCIARGALMRQRGCVCSRPRRRMCELHMSGRLHIAIDAYDALIVDLAEFCEEPVIRAEEGREGAWRVKNPQTRQWELVIAASERDAKVWGQAFADALRYGSVARFPEVVFRGFLWKLVSSEPQDVVPQHFDVALWRCRLYLLLSNGQLIVYSHKDERDVVVCDFSRDGCQVERASFQWKGIPSITPFQVSNPEANRIHTLASTNETFEAFRARVGTFSHDGALTSL